MIPLPVVASMESRPTATAQTVRRALQVLGCFRGAAELGVSDIARELQLPTSTVHRLLRSLVEAGFLDLATPLVVLRAVPGTAIRRQLRTSGCVDEQLFEEPPCGVVLRLNDLLSVLRHRRCGS